MAVEQSQLGTATVLFTDVVGSTEGRRRLGDAKAEKLREMVESTQIEVIKRHQGRVVKGTGDGVMAVFTSAGAALASAAEIVVCNRAATRREGGPIQLRVGLSAGDVSQVGGDVFGTPVVEAARLCAAAADDEILVSDVVRTLAGSWEGFPLIDRGDIELKGLGSVRCWALDWSETPIPAPAGVGILVDEEFPFVGRVRELKVLHDIWMEVTAGACVAVFLVGQAGVGKTRLLVETAREIRAAGGLVLSGRCEEGMTAPLLPFQGAVDMYLRNQDAATVKADAGPYLDEVGRHFPAFAAHAGVSVGTPDPDAETERWRLLAGLNRIVREAASRQATALLIDDVQWADPATRILLERMLHQADGGAVGLFVTCRDGAGEPGNEGATWLGSLERLPQVQVLEVGGLDADDLRLLVDRSQANVDAEALWEQTAGHPFFVSELVRYARDHSESSAAVPRSIQALLESRVGRLGDATVDLLTTGAVAGAEFDLGLIAEITGLGERDAVHAVEEAAAARFLIEVPNRFDRYQFTHRLMVDVITANTSRSRRTRIHRDLAAALEQRGGPSAEVAHHLLAATPLVGKADAIGATRSAAKEAVTKGSPDQAVSLLEGALAIADDPVVRAELALEIGNALNFAGRAAAGVPWFEGAAAGAIEQDQFDLLTEAALGCWAGNPWYANFDPRAPQLLQAALERCPADDRLSRARLQAGLAAFSIFTAPLGERDRVTAEAVALARDEPNPATLAATLVTRHIAINCPLALEEVDRIEQELAEMSAHTNTGLPQLLDVPVAAGYSTGVSCPQYWRADGEAYRAVVAALEPDDPRTPDWIATVGFQLEAAVAIVEGRLPLAKTAADRAAEIGGWGDSSLGTHMWQRLVIDWLEGDIAASRQRVAALHERFGGQPTRCTLAWTEAAGGNESAARELLHRVRLDRLPRLPELFLGSIALATCAMAVWHLGDPAWAEAAITAFEPVSDLMSGVPWTPLPAGQFFVGLMHTILGDAAAADATFTAAAAIHQRLQAPAFTALTQAAHGGALAESDPARSVDLLSRARATAETLGLGGVLDMASSRR